MAWRKQKTYLARTFNSNWSFFQNLKALDFHLHQHWIGHRCKNLAIWRKKWHLFRWFCCATYVSVAQFFFLPKKCITLHLWPANCKWQTPSNLSHLFVGGNEKSNHIQCLQLKMIFSFAKEMSNIDLLGRTSKLVELETLIQSILY